MKIKKKSYEQHKYVDDYAFELTRVAKEDTGLPYDLWIDSIGNDRSGKLNGLVIRVQVEGRFIPILIPENPDISQNTNEQNVENLQRYPEVKEYIKAYYEVFLAHYNKILTDKETLLILSTADEEHIINAKKILDEKCGKKKQVTENSPTFGMSVVQPKRSGLDCKIWLNDFGEKRESGYHPFSLKYGDSLNDCITVPFFEKQETYTYFGKPERGKVDIDKLSQWINVNYGRLIRFYKQEVDYDFVDFMLEMEAVK